MGWGEMKVEMTGDFAFSVGSLRAFGMKLWDAWRDGAQGTFTVCRRFGHVLLTERSFTAR